MNFLTFPCTQISIPLARNEGVILYGGGGRIWRFRCCEEVSHCCNASVNARALKIG